MAYSGSGTQADPYVVTTIADFLDAVDNHRGSYIKVANDIDCYTDSTYTGAVTHALDISATHIFADTPVSISGLTVQGSAFFLAGTVTSGNGYIDNVSFINCVFKQTVKYANGGVFDGNNASYRVIVSNCSFSMIVSLGAYEYPLFNYITATNCSFYFKVVNTGYPYLFTYHASSSNYSSYNVFSSCNIIIDSMKIKLLGHCLLNYGDSSKYYVAVQGTTTAIIYKNCDIIVQPDMASAIVYGNYTRGVASHFFDNSYLAMIGCTLRNTNNQAVTTICGEYYTMTGSIGFVATDDTNLTLTNSGTTLLATTVANLRDENYLINNGFLP